MTEARSEKYPSAPFWGTADWALLPPAAGWQGTPAPCGSHPAPGAARFVPTKTWGHVRRGERGKNSTIPRSRGQTRRREMAAHQPSPFPRRAEARRHEPRPGPARPLAKLEAGGASKCCCLPHAEVAVLKAVGFRVFFANKNMLFSL